MTKPQTDTLNSTIEELGKPYIDFHFLLECLSEIIKTKPDLVNSAIPWLSEISTDTLSNDDIRIYSIAFHLLNIAEENGAIQSRRQTESGNPANINGSWTHNLQSLIKEGYESEAIADSLSQLTIQPVLTAHPTEAVRATILEHHRDLYLQLVKKENTMWTPHEQEEIKTEIKTILERLIGTGEIFIEKPDLNAEVRNMIHYFTQSFPPVIAKLDSNLKFAWEQSGLSIEALSTNKLPQIKFGNWVGGDRDGHPFVTSDFTAQVLSQFRLNALVVIRRVLLKLIRELSFTYPIDEMPQDFINKLNAYASEMKDVYKGIISRNKNEAFRQYLSVCLYKLPLSIKREHATQLYEHEFCYTNKDQLLEDLSVIEDALKMLNFNSANNSIQEAIRLVKTFGFHLAEIDMRQNSTFHDKAITQLLEIANHEDSQYIDWGFDKKTKWLNKELSSTRPLSLINSLEENEAYKTVTAHAVFNSHIEKYGSDGIGVLIVSMTRHESDLLGLYLLGRESGLTFQHEGKIVFKVPVVPLFETIEDLEASAPVMDAFLSHPITRNSIEYHKKVSCKKNLEQLVMVGYSDSNKDGGILASQWALYEGQSKLVEIGKKHSVDIQFFHGKGGTISRGAGPTHHFIKALPPHSINNKMRLTEQGESISQKYANPVNASFNLELLTANSLFANLSTTNKDNEVYKYAEVFQTLAKNSFKKYRKLVNHEHFLTFYGEATPIDVIESSKIGSRPARRTGQRTLADLRAIPWVFSWSQSRFNITGWFGVGTALQKLKDENKQSFETIKEGIQADTFLRYVFTNIETLLSSTNDNAMKLYASLVQDEEIRNQVLTIILDELETTRSMISELFGSDINARRKNYALSNRLREEGLWKLHETQVDLLKRWRVAKLEDSPNTDNLLLSLLMTVNGIAGALKGTG